MLQVKIFSSKVKVNGSPSVERGNVQMEHHEVFFFFVFTSFPTLRRRTVQYIVYVVT